MAEQPSSSPSSKEHYTLGYSSSVHQWMSQRKAASHASFFLPHLRSGMSLLDCGCGPGSITIDLADIVAPGNVIGLDKEPLQIERAKALAETRNVSNIQFVVGDVYHLPFAAASFDAVFAHAVLYHVHDPLAVLKEFHRVLKPGGIVGIRDTDYSMWTLEPMTPYLEEIRQLILRYAIYQGASPTYARSQRSLLLEAGFERTEALASCVSNGTIERTRTSARGYAARMQSAEFRQIAIEQEWCDEARLETLCKEIQKWGERPDAFELLVWRSIIGWA